MQGFKSQGFKSARSAQRFLLVPRGHLQYLQRSAPSYLRQHEPSLPGGGHAYVAQDHRRGLSRAAWTVTLRPLFLNVTMPANRLPLMLNALLVWRI
jgi:hypothetical protein